MGNLQELILTFKHTFLMMTLPRLLFLILLFSLNIIVDQISKWIAMTHLDYSVVHSFWYDTIRIVYVENTGVAFSLGSDWSPEVRFLVFNLVVLAVLLGLLFYLIKTHKEQSFVKLIAFTLILAGGFGNLIDRFFREGAVVDFLNVGIGFVRTAIFNHADMCITTGLIILIIISIRESFRKPEMVLEEAKEEVNG